MEVGYEILVGGTCFCRHWFGATRLGALSSFFSLSLGERSFVFDTRFGARAKAGFAFLLFLGFLFGIFLEKVKKQRAKVKAKNS